MDLIPHDQLWMVIVGFIIAFVLAIGIGANDVANTFGSSVGSKVLTLRRAFILASIFELAGCIFLGARVSDTIRKGIITLEPYNNTEQVLVVGNIAALTGACSWLLVATIANMPVSGTHSIVGATLGFALVAHGTQGIQWVKLGLIAASWIVSPLLSGALSVLLFALVKWFILTKDDVLSAGLRFLPIFYGCTVIINTFSIFYEGPEQLHFDKIPLWGTFIISFGLGIIVTVSIKIWYVPWQRKKITGELKALMESDVKVNGAVNMDGLAGEENGNVKASADPEAIEMCHLDKHVKHECSCPADSKTYLLASTQINGEQQDDAGDKLEPDANKPPEVAFAKKDHVHIADCPEAFRLFSFLQILSAIFGAFAHGGNDVSNAIGPLVGVWMIMTEGNVLQKAETPIWVLFYGGAGIVLGLWLLGKRVIKTMGENLSTITPSSGFCIELGAALTVLVASNVGLPISTTHCKVGSVIFVGLFRSRQNVDWKLFRGIIFAWIATLPAAGLVSAGVMYGLQHLVPPLGPPWASSGA